ncbi:hypothetical protein AB0N65_20505 [Paenarthrobacter sp. NPDC089322]|uniref:hypothetical protein n=1 Tax=Paenarthrobacter sp. NPDC089322 TaxID=3155065 RepID=UPI00343B9267
MTLGIVLMAIGLLWLSMRKWIARRQYSAAAQMLGKPDELKEERARGLEKFGVFFCYVLIVGGLIIVILTLIFRPPWGGA